MQQLQKKSEAQCVLLVFNSSENPNYRGPGYFCPVEDVVDSRVKYRLMLNYPKVLQKFKCLLNNMVKIIFFVGYSKIRCVRKVIIRK